MREREQAVKEKRDSKRLNKEAARNAPPGEEDAPESESPDGPESVE
jgi:hypothetical protein